MAEQLNRDTVLVYLDGAREALASAHYNFDGGYYGVAVNRAYVADYEQLGRADPDQAQAVIKNSERFVDRCVSFLKGQGYL